MQAIEVLKAKGIDVPELMHGAHNHAGCPGSKVMEFAKNSKPSAKKSSVKTESELQQWPV